MNPAGPQSEVLVIDDEDQIRRLLRGALTTAGYRVREASDGLSGLGEVAHHRPDVIILDLGLPDLSGLEILRRLREWSQVPVLILSVRGQEKEKIEALDAGANDYMTKPFGWGEMLARLRVLLRREPAAVEANVAQFGPVTVDLGRRVVTKHGQELKLTAREYALLRLLVTHRNKVITHRQILRELWGPGAEAQTHYVRVYMARLRQKIEEEPNQPRFLITEAGSGYRLDTD
ncbi:response regulator [Opitutus sp. GAS368]|jgi:two-component system KDP operon response regulator KdpE|uniref:response regulator n=1 Tax=Opitutus sp. GAS368 TaxID=1882749 RepID=UPI000879C8D7|nr:response regulator [Opitutus sp. GAS368]SDR83773.1 two-component system, OmpR family, KDP operon response regulator KdpE [Opitutus sp. GAS368]